MQEGCVFRCVKSTADTDGEDCFQSNSSGGRDRDGRRVRRWVCSDGHPRGGSPCHVCGCELEGVGEVGREGVGREDEVEWSGVVEGDGGRRVGDGARERERDVHIALTCSDRQSDLHLACEFLSQLCNYWIP